MVMFERRQAQVARRTFATLLFLSAVVVSGGCLQDPNAIVPPTADQDPSLPQLAIEVAGQSRVLHLETFGDEQNPPLFVLHGSLVDYRGLRPLAEQLATRYFVVIWDQRGNGLSERIPREEYTFDSVVDEIDALKQEFAPDTRVTLVGHSFGAMYAALYMSTYPDRVEQAALLEPGGLNGTIFGEVANTIINVDLLNPNLNESYWQNETLSPADHAQLDYKGLLVLENPDQANYYCDDRPFPRMPVWRPGVFVEVVRGDRMAEGAPAGAQFGFDFAFGLADFPRPVLLVGSECGALNFEFQQEFHEPLFNDVELVRIDDAGHRLYIEQPVALFTALASYLAEF